MAIADVIDQFGVFGKPIHITALGSPSEEIETGETGTSTGRWHEDSWNPQTQADWLTGAMTVALAKPIVKSVCWQALYDVEEGGEMPGGGLITVQGRAKPSLKRAGELLGAFHQDKLPRKLIEGSTNTKASASS